jgi:hypothetical protein
MIELPHVSRISSLHTNHPTTTQWVIVSTTGGEQVTIPAARAAIAIGHLHFGAVGVFAAYSKNSVKDKLLLEPGEKDEAPAGLFPAIRPGLTKDAEMLNGA